MNSRQRVLAAINHQEPDRVPLDLGGSRPAAMYETVYRSLMAHYDYEVDPGTVFNHRGEVVPCDERLLRQLGIDLRRVRLNDPDRRLDYFADANNYFDEWGIRWQKEGPFWSPVGNPLAGATLADLDAYPWPNPLDEGRFRGVREQALRLQETEYAVVASQPVPAYGVFTTANLMRGMAQFMVDLAVDPEFADALMQRILDFHLAIYKQFLELVGDCCQIVVTSDDLGTQQSMLISPNMYRDLVKPLQAQLFSAVRAGTPARIFYHSCGAISPVIPDLIEMGVEILNPVQPLAEGMDSATLKANWGEQLTFHGGIDQQQCMTSGSVADVEAEVAKRLRLLGPGGGYIMAVVHNIMPDTPVENVLALFDAAQRLGRYPLPE